MLFQKQYLYSFFIIGCLLFYCTKSAFAEVPWVKREDWDKIRDGLPDIIVASAQAIEGIYGLFNNGKVCFEEIQFLSFHPLFGLADFEMVDINGDGYLDILLANGDNADLSPILKPYHGLRLFLNDQKNNFHES